MPAKKQPARKVNLAQISTKRNFARQKVDDLHKDFADERAKDRREIDLVFLRNLRDNFERYGRDLENYDEIIQQSIQDDEELETEVNESEQIMDHLKRCIIEIVNLIDVVGQIGQTGNGSDDNQSVGSSRRSGASQSVKPKLPKLEIAKFNGDPIRWQEFWDQFESLIHSNGGLSDVDKFNYLKSYLEGEALRAIEGIALTNAQYPVAIQIITERFGNKEVALAAHFEKILQIPPVTKKTSELRSFYDEIEKHIRCLGALGLKTEEYAKAFVPMILAKLPADVKLELNRRKGDAVWDLETLRKLLREEVKAREESSGPKEEMTPKEPRFEKAATRKGPHAQVKTASALVSNSKMSMKKCSFCCDTTHFSDECPKYPDVESRKRCLGNKRCYNCLRTGHFTKKCSVMLPCFHCKAKGHHRSLCPKNFGGQQSTELTNSTGGAHAAAVVTQTLAVSAVSDSKTATMLAPTQKTILPTATAVIESPHGRKSGIIKCRLVLDSGSQRSYITETVANKLKLVPVGSEALEVSTFGSDLTKVVRLQIANIKIRVPNGSATQITVNVVPIISVPIQKAKIDISQHKFIEQLTLAEPLRDHDEDIKLDLLIGSDYYDDFVGGKKIEVERGLYLKDSVFGWILSGRVESADQNSKSAASTLFAPSTNWGVTPLDVTLEKFWKLESIGITECGQVSDDDVAIQKFNETVKFENRRYSVAWPWKEATPSLPENFELAHGRLKSLQKRLDQQPEVRDQYCEIIKRQLDAGIIERVGPDTPVGPRKHYLPHHVVVREESVSTKFRIVYDASAKTNKNANSLNDCLYRGPVLLQDLCGILLRFRSFPIGVLSDIEKAFLQIGLHIEDRDVTRFLWINSEKELETYRFCRIPFGVISSPFLLEATVAHHLKLNGSDVAQKIRQNIYVDNVCVGVDTAEEGKELYATAKNIFKDASMNLREWCSNSKELLEFIPPDNRLNSEKIKLLGLAWKLDQDTLGVQKCKFEILGPITKRKMLACVSGIYDPLGLFSPVVIRAKLAIQNLWKSKLDWDAPVPESVENEWNGLKNDLSGITDLTVKRFTGIKILCKARRLTLKFIAFATRQLPPMLHASTCVWLKTTKLSRI